MKQNVKISGEVEFSQAEVKDALLIYAIEEDKKYLNFAIAHYLKIKYDYKMKTLASSKVGDEIVVKAEIGSNKADGGNVLYKPEKDKVNSNNGGVARPHTGFYEELITILQEHGADKKGVAYEVVRNELMRIFPTLGKRRISMYVRDKRQQPKKGFSFANDILKLTK